jgi:hypothetical protein
VILGLFWHDSVFQEGWPEQLCLENEGLARTIQRSCSDLLSAIRSVLQSTPVERPSQFDERLRRLNIRGYLRLGATLNAGSVEALALKPPSRGVNFSPAIPTS